jgi:peptidoglycan/xylan/chitin deacetylase (PgdA/CDA1 family)
MIRLSRPFPLLRLIYPEAVFRLASGKKEIYLTFDDGPSAESTNRILEILDLHGLKATFFCAGSEAEKHPELLKRIVSIGHTVGNHGYCHLDGWKTNTGQYAANAASAEKYTSEYLFRPPYGRLKPSQYRILKQKYTIVFWDILCHDFDSKISSDEVLDVLKRRTRPGSVIVLHDKPVTSATIILDEFITWAQREGYSFSKIVPSPQK